jgi:hypothetical protein
MKNIIYYFFINLTIIIMFFLFTKSLFSSIEKFTPSMRCVYRPIVRNTRIISEEFYNKTTSNISNLFRKFGIM